jgi:hypothetical protein
VDLELTGQRFHALDAARRQHQIVAVSGQLAR